MARPARSTAKQKPPKRRRSRWARWVLRPLIWSPALLALLVVAVLIALESQRFADWAVGAAESQAAAYLGREVEIGSLSIDLIPLSIEARNVVVAGPGTDEATESNIRGQDDGAFVEVARIQIDARVRTLLRPGITLERVFVERPVIRIGFDESGRHNAPRPRRRAPDAPRRFDFAIGTVEVVGGTLELDHRKFPLELTARDFVANLVGLEGEDDQERVVLAGQVRADEVTVVLPNARPYLGSVSLRGTYRGGGFDISEGRFDAPDLSAQLVGIVRWRDDPRANFTIRASGEGRLLDRLGYGEGLLAGPFEFAGEFDRSEQDWSLAGRLSSPGIVVVERRLDRVTGRLQVDTESARYRIESALYGGGVVTGSVRMASGSGEAPVELDLRVADVRIERLLEDQKIPIAGLAAAVSGNFTYQFARSEPRRGNGWADLKIERRPQHAGLPVHGSAVMSFEDGRLRTEAVRLTGDNQLIVAAGTYDMVTSQGRFELELTTQGIGEALALLPVDDPTALWRPARGQGDVSAQIDLQDETVVVTTEFNLDDVAAPGFEANRAQGRFRLDARGLEDLRIELLRPAAAVIVSGSIPLAEEPGASVPLALAVDAEGWPLSEFAPWLPFELTVRGPFSGGATIEGFLESPRGSASGRVDTPSFGDLTASSLDFDLDFSVERIVVHEARVGFGEGAVRARGTYDLQADRIALEIDSDALELATLGALPVAGERLSGALEVSGMLGGTSATPEASIRFDIASAAIDGEPIGSNGSGELLVDWNGRELEGEGGIEGLIRVAGGGVVEGALADLEFEVTSPDIRSILLLLGPESLPEFEATGRGRLGVQGPLGTESMPTARLFLDELRFRYSGERIAKTLENLEPVALRFERDALVVESFYLGTEDGVSDLFAAGRIGFGEDKKLDLNVQGSLGARWFAPWAPDGVELAEGSFDIIGSIVGSLEEPRFDGVGQYSGGKVVTTGFPATFDGTEAVFLFFPGQVVLDQLSARVAGGRMQAAGTIDVRASGDFDYRFQVSGEGLNFRYPEGWSIRGKTDLTVASIPGGRQITGAMDLDRALYVTDVPIELDQLLRSYFEQRRLEVEETDELLATTQLNLAVAAKETLRIRNNLANLRGSADLVIRGSLARPVVFGTIEFDPSGRLVYSGNTYELERGLLTFANPHRLEPIIDLVAHTDLREYQVTLGLSGTPERLSFDFISDPPLAELEVMALMTGGRPRGPNFGETRRSASLEGDNLGAETFLYGQATSLVASRFNRLFGLDQFRIVPLTSATGDLSSARVTVGKQLTRDLFATYSYDPSETAEQIFELEWSISRSLVLVITQNGDGTYAVDAKYEKAF